MQFVKIKDSNSIAISYFVIYFIKKLCHIGFT